MKILAQSEINSLIASYERFKDGCDIDAHAGIFPMGEFAVGYDFEFGNFGIIGLNDFWIEKDGIKFYVPSVIRKPLEQLINRLGRPAQKLPEGSPLALLMFHAK